MSRKGRGETPYPIDQVVMVGERPDPLEAWRAFAALMVDQGSVEDATGVEMVLDALTVVPGHNCYRTHGHDYPHIEAGIHGNQYHHHHDEACKPMYRLEPPQ